MQLDQTYGSIYHCSYQVEISYNFALWYKLINDYEYRKGEPDHKEPQIEQQHISSSLSDAWM